MTRPLVVPVLLVLACALAERVGAQAPAGDPMPGVWRLNVEKSVFSPGPAPRASTYRYENRPDGFTLWTQSGLNGAGNPTFSFSLRKYDGNEYPVYNVASLTTFVTTGEKASQTQVARRIDAYTTEVVNMSNGKATTTTTRTLARDGKTFTMRTKGTNAAGQAIDDTTVWEKQVSP
jgi:hypothetical protein